MLQKQYIKTNYQSFQPVSLIYKCKIFNEITPRCIIGDQGPYSQHFILIMTYKQAW